MNLAIIPARGGSKRIKNKNIISFAGKPMIYYPINAAKKSKIFDFIHVSSDSNKILNLAKKFGIKKQFRRPKSLSDDYTGILPVLRFVLNQYESKYKIKINNIFCIFPAAPFLTKKYLIDAYKLFKKNKSKYPLHVVSEYNAPIQWAFELKKNKILKPKEPGKFKIRSQDLKRYYYECGPFSIFSRNHIIKNVQDKNFLGFVMPKYKSIDIDTKEDLEFARKLIKK